ncbi:MAG: amidohydrolase family protein [Chthonomonadaceae bacterium]|nr:amidohydrolase family protein [Chthonomonadaceae bacterium]
MTGLFLALGPEGFGTYKRSEDGTLSPTPGTPDGILVPGLVDVHIHGAYGLDFMSNTPQQSTELCDKLASIGYEALLPTTVTSSAANVQNFLANLPEHPLIAGFHLEGPFISPEFPGAQPQSSIVSYAAAFDEWQPVLEDPRLRVVTLAPEIDGHLSLIENLSSKGVTVSLGHTAATEYDAHRAFRAGATQTTHTFNAMRPLHHREPSLLGAAMVNDDVQCELIYDRAHVARPVADILIRCKGTHGVLAVSDCSAAAGMPDGHKFEMWGHKVVLRNGNVVIDFADEHKSTLAGSTATLYDCFKNMWSDFGPEVAIRTCCLNPRHVARVDPDPSTWLILDHRLEICERLTADRP